MTPIIQAIIRMIVIPASASSGIHMGAITHIHEYGNCPVIFRSASTPDSSSRIGEHLRLTFNSILRVEGENVQFLSGVQSFSEHAVLFDWFDLVSHVMRVVGDGLAFVGDADSGGHRMTSSTRARLLTGMVLLTPFLRFLNVNDNGFMQFSSSKSMMHSMSSQQLIHGEPTSLGSA